MKMRHNSQLFKRQTVQESQESDKLPLYLDHLNRPSTVLEPNRRIRLVQKIDSNPLKNQSPLHHETERDRTHMTFESQPAGAPAHLVSSSLSFKTLNTLKLQTRKSKETVYPKHLRSPFLKPLIMNSPPRNQTYKQQDV
jgi:hypothetical protein